MSSALIRLIVLAFIAVVLTGCGAVDGDPPANVQQGMRKYLDEAQASQPRGRTPRIEPAAPQLMASSPLVRSREQFTLSETASEALARIGPSSVPPVTAMLSDPDPAIRARSAAILARIGPDARDAVPELTALLADSDPFVQKEAARALGQIGPEAAAAVPSLVRAAADPQARK
jgi:hypothetical protein